MKTLGIEIMDVVRSIEGKSARVKVLSEVNNDLIKVNFKMPVRGAKERPVTDVDIEKLFDMEFLKGKYR